MNNIIEKFRKGYKIHIKESQKGSFTKWCGGNVTDKCIQRGKNSSNPKIRKKATFAANARKWKHKKGGKAFVNGVNILDSNPKAYKYVKKKYKMRSAQEGTKFNIGEFLNSNSGKFVINGITNLLTTASKNKSIKAEADAQKAQNEIEIQKQIYDINQKNKEEANNYYQQWINNYNNGNTFDNPSQIVAQHFGYQNLGYDKLNQELKIKNKQIEQQASVQKSNNWGNAFSNIIQEGMGLFGNYLSNKSKNGSPSITNGLTSLNQEFKYNI